MRRRDFLLVSLASCSPSQVDQKAVAAISLTSTSNRFASPRNPATKALSGFRIARGATNLGNPAVLHDSDAVRQGGRLVLIMRRTNGCTERSMKLSIRIASPRAGSVEGTERLVHQK
jgi:hypothetical protein